MIIIVVILLSMSLSSVQGPEILESTSLLREGQIPHDFEQVTFSLSQPQFLICKVGIIIAYLFHKDLLRKVCDNALRHSQSLQ